MKYIVPIGIVGVLYMVVILGLQRYSFFERTWALDDYKSCIESGLLKEDGCYRTASTNFDSDTIDGYIYWYD